MIRDNATPVYAVTIRRDATLYVAAVSRDDLCAAVGALDDADLEFYLDEPTTDVAYCPESQRRPEYELRDGEIVWIDTRAPKESKP